MSALQRMPAPLRLLVLVALGIALPIGAAREAAAQEIRSEAGVSISLVSGVLPGFSGRGYSELRFSVDNESDQTHDVEVHVGALAIERSTSMSALAKASVAPKSQREITVVLPSFASDPYGYTPVSTTIDGVARSAPISIEFAGGTSFDASLSVVVFSDRALGGGFEGSRAAALGSKSYSALDPASVDNFALPAPVWYQSQAAWSGGTVLQRSYIERQRARMLSSGSRVLPYLVNLRPTALMPASVHSYTSIDAVVLDGGPVDPARSTELARWVRLGGCVVVARDGSFTSFGDLEDARRPGALLCTFGEAEVRRLGLGTVVFSSADPLESDGQLQALWWTLERCPSWIVPSIPIPDNDVPPRWHFAQLRLEGIGALSHNVLLGFLIVIAVVMAPLNLLLVHRTRRPVALLLTIPLLSLIGSAGVICYGVMRDGLGVVDSVASWAVLDQESQMVSSVSVRTMFAGMSVGRRLSPGAGTIVLPIDIDGSFELGDGRYQVERDMEAGVLQFTGDYLPARRIHSQVVLTDRSSRKRLAVSRTGDVISAENALGATVRELWLRDLDGQLWHTSSEVAAGSVVELTPSKDEAELELYLSKIAPAPYMNGFERLAPGSYATELLDLIAEDDCGVTAKRTNVRQGLVGILEAQALR